MWNRKGNLKLNVADIIYTLPVRVTSSYDNYVEDFYQRRDTRAVALAFSYPLWQRQSSPYAAAPNRGQTGAKNEKAGPANEPFL